MLKAFADPRMAFHETVWSALHEIFDMWRLFRHKCAVPRSLRFSSGESPTVEPHIEMVERFEELPKYCEVVWLQLRKAVDEATTIVAERISCSKMLQEMSTKRQDTFQRRLGLPGRKLENLKMEPKIPTKRSQLARDNRIRPSQRLPVGEGGSMIRKWKPYDEK